VFTDVWNPQLVKNLALLGSLLSLDHHSTCILKVTLYTSWYGDHWVNPSGFNISIID
jgi:hypothetical protein